MARSWIGVLVAVAVLALAGFLLVRTVGRYDLADIHAALGRLEGRQLAAAALLAAASYLVLTGVDLLGVRYAVHGQKREARAVREVIVSAGAIASPQLLELSGIGQADRLKGLGIEVRHNLAGVGEKSGFPSGSFQ